MLKVVEARFHCVPEFDAVVEVERAIESHLRQITKKAKGVDSWSVDALTPVEVEAAARSDLLASMDNLTTALDKLRVEGKLT